MHREERPFEGWYYKQDGQALGPIPTGRLKELLAAGRVQPRQAVWQRSSDGLHFVHAAAAAFGTTVPACPPSPPEPGIRLGPVSPPVPIPSAMSSAHGQPGPTGAADEPKAPGGWHLAHLSAIHEIGALLDTVAGAMTGLGFPDEDTFGVRLALEEALVNAVKHGHGHDPAKRVVVRYQVVQEYALLEVEDQGPGFDPLHVPDPSAPENLERPGGRGLLLMRAYASWIRHNERGNCVTLCKYPSEPSANRASGPGQKGGQHGDGTPCG
jgi:serine/threonine-protein kinase RsbW